MLICKIVFEPKHTFLFGKRMRLQEKSSQLIDELKTFPVHERSVPPILSTISLYPPLPHPGTTDDDSNNVLFTDHETLKWSLKIIRTRNERLGYPSSSNILNDSDCLEIVKYKTSTSDTQQTFTSLFKSPICLFESHRGTRYVTLKQTTVEEVESMQKMKLLKMYAEKKLCWNQHLTVSMCRRSHSIFLTKTYRPSSSIGYRIRT